MEDTSEQYDPQVAKTARNIPPLAGALETGSKIHERLDQAITVLENKLSPVLTPMSSDLASKASPADKAEADPLTSDVTTQVLNHNSRLNSLSRRLENLAERLEV